MPTAAFSLREFPEHAEIIGDMLLGFTDLEFFTVDLVGCALADPELSTAIRVLYRLRGANDRLNVADAILRPYMDGIKLKAHYAHWLGAMRRCKVIRNQYAHCGWSDDGEGCLTFVNLEAAAQIIDEEPRLEFYPLKLSLLKEQQAYFEYTIELTAFLVEETKFRKDPLHRHTRKYPKSRAAPKLHSPRD